MNTDVIDEVSNAELRARLEDRDPLLLLDVLPSTSYELGHIPGAVSLPFHALEARAAALLPDKEQEVAVYCAGYD